MDSCESVLITAIAAWGLARVAAARATRERGKDGHPGDSVRADSSRGLSPVRVRAAVRPRRARGAVRRERTCPVHPSAKKFWSGPDVQTCGSSHGPLRTMDRWIMRRPRRPSRDDKMVEAGSYRRRAETGEMWTYPPSDSGLHRQPLLKPLLVFFIGQRGQNSRQYRSRRRERVRRGEEGEPSPAWTKSRSGVKGSGTDLARSFATADAARSRHRSDRSNG